jgi:hypothetical protein
MDAPAAVVAAGDQRGSPASVAPYLECEIRYSCLPERAATYGLTQASGLRDRVCGIEAVVPGRPGTEAGQNGWGGRSRPIGS